MLKVAFFNLFRNKARTALSALGIVIGVAAIISMVSVVDGFFSDVTNAIGQIQGINVMQVGVPPIYSQIDESLGEKIASISGVSVVVPQIQGPIGLIDGKQLGIGGTQLIGIDFAKQKQARASGVQGKIVDGREIRAGEKGVAVIGKLLRDDFDKFVGQKIEINNHDLLVVGVYETSSELLNSAVLVPISDARTILEFPSGKVTAFSVELHNPENIDRVVDVVNFRFSGENIRAASSSDISGQFGDILGSFRLLVVAVAAISAVVAGVGIINTMLMSVLERFKEIGALKAVGWANSDIMAMILVESVLLGVFGAVAGIVLGVLVSFAVSSAVGITTLVTPVLLAEVFVFAVSLGIAGGLYPAYIASKMDPVEALRAE